MAGTERAAGGPDVREEALDNQLGELRAKQEEYARFDPADPRINEIEDVIKELEVERVAIRQEPKATVLNAPSQQGFDFNAPEEPGVEPVRALKTEPTEFALTPPEGAAPTAEEPIEPIVEPDRAKMMLIGDAKAPMKPLESFFNSLKPATVMPAEVTKFKEEARKLLDDVAEFIGGKITKQVSRFEGAEKGPDVSAELTGPELDARLGYVRDFFDSLSIAPKEREALTSALSQRFAGM